MSSAVAVELSSMRNDVLMSPLLTPSRQPPLTLLSMAESPSLSDSFAQENVDEMRAECRALRSRMKSQQNEIEAERDTITLMRKKLNAVERDRLDAASHANEEISRLDSEVTRLQAQLERGEANRQSLEYELARVKKENVESRRAAGDRESLMQGLSDGTKRKLDEVSAQVDHLCAELEEHKTRAKEEGKRLRVTIHNKDEELFSCHSERDALERENQKLAISNEDKDKLVEELEDQLKSFQGGHREQAENLRRQIHENEFLREKGDRQRKDYEIAHERIRILEESVEAERAAHLESKFNSEIVQLRIRDLEAALEVEQKHKSETSSVSDNLCKQIRELQQTYEEEKLGKQYAQENVRKVEKELSLDNLQLRGDVSEKTSLIKQLSSQLDIHQTNFNELKQELTKAKKRQVFLEETYTGSIKELEILLDNFEPVSLNRLTSNRTNRSTKTSAKKSGASRTQTLSSLLESLRRILIDYKRKLNDTVAELARLKSQTENVSKESEQYKGMLWHKDKALETAQQGLVRTSKELRHYQTEARELEMKVGNLTKELGSAKSNLEKNCKENEALAEQVLKVATKCRTDEQTSGEFLHALHRQLFAVSSTLPSSPLPTVDVASVQSWEDLARLVSEQTALVISQLQRYREKVAHHETLTRNKDATIQELRTTHENELSKLSSITDGRSEHWAQQRVDMETHYTQLLSELHARHKKTQTLTDQAWDKVRANTTVQRGLEAQCVQLQSTLSQQEDENRALGTVVALLCSVLLPLADRTCVLIDSKIQQTEENARLGEMKLQLSCLVEALRWECADPPKPSPDMLPILRFRTAVVAIMAANRLSHLGRNPASFTTIRGGFPGLPVLDFHVGPAVGDQGIFVGGDALTESANKDTLEKRVVTWLSSDAVPRAAMSAVFDLTTLLKSDSYNSSQLATTVQVCMERLLKELHQTSFVHLMTSDPHLGLHVKHSLCGRLGRGLRDLLGRLQQDGKHCYMNSQNIANTLQEQVLGFTRRLHAAEVERRDLRQEVVRLQDARNTLTDRADLAEHLRAEVVELQGQVENCVEQPRFDAVCAELTNALHREQEAQHLLKQQASQLHQLTLQMDAQVLEGSHKEQTLIDAVRDLNEAKSETRRQEQRARQLSRQLETYEEDKKQLQGNVSDAEAALRTAARDRDNLTCYLHNLHRFTESINSHIALQMNSPSNIERMLSPHLIPNQPSNKPSAAFTACRSLVSAFVDLQKQLEARVEALQETVKSDQQHVLCLKQELREACQMDLRPPQHQIDNLAIAEADLANFPIDKVLLKGQTDDADFKPLQLDESSLMKPTKSQSSKTAMSTPSRSTRSSMYQTSQASAARGLKAKSKKGKN